MQLVNLVKEPDPFELTVLPLDPTISLLDLKGSMRSRRELKYNISLLDSGIVIQSIHLLNLQEVLNGARPVSQSTIDQHQVHPVPTPQPQVISKSPLRHWYDQLQQQVCNRPPQTLMIERINDDPSRLLLQCEQKQGLIIMIWRNQNLLRHQEKSTSRSLRKSLLSNPKSRDLDLRGTVQKWFDPPLPLHLVLHYRN